MRAAATAAGVSNTTWSRMESGAVAITAPMAASIARAFDWPADWETNPPVTLSQPMTTLDADELLARIRSELAEHERRIQVMLERLTGSEDDNVERDQATENREQHR